MILDKKQMTEEDIKLQYITPAIQSKWGLDRMTMETKITDGRVNLRGNFVCPMRIAGYFGGKEGSLKAVRELEKELYKVG